MDVYFGKMDRSVMISLQDLHTLRVSSVWIYQLQGLRVRSFTMKQPRYDVGNLPALESLCLILHGKPKKHNPHSNLSGLPSLTDITFCGEIHRGGVQQDPAEDTGNFVMSQRVKNLYLSGRMWFRNPQFWLAPFADTIRHLSLYGVHTSHSVRDLTFPHLEIIESHWCSPCILQGGHYPSLRKYSESVVLTGSGNQLILSAIKDCLDQIDTLAIRAECSQYFQGERSGCSVDFRQIFPDLLSAQASGGLKSCFVDGSFSNIPIETPHWLFLLGPMHPEDSKKRSAERHKMLRTIDPSGHFWETENSEMTHLDRNEPEEEWLHSHLREQAR